MTPRKRKKATRKKPRRRKKGPHKLFLLSLIINILFFGFLAWGIFDGNFQEIFKPKKEAPKKVERPGFEAKEKTWKIKEVFKPRRKLSPNKPKLIFIIDDMGNTRRNEKLFLDLENEITYAILPFLPYSGHFSKLSKKTNADVILHLPLESRKGTWPGPGLITTRMSEENVKDLLDRNLKTVPQYIGVNSHMGSLGTTNERLMEIILKEVKRRRLFFLDSYTSGGSVVMRVGDRVGARVIKRDIFLDNVDEPGAIRSRIREAKALARRKGHAISIGHDRENTLQVLIEEIPKLKKEGFEIATLGEIVDFLKI